MGSKNKIERARSMLHCAISKNDCKETILKYSRQVDRHIIDYYRNNFRKGRCRN
ncbi:MAG: Spo0E family sporulation regulatory protein-aspartic acid phosphatase [Thermoanaerobacteraceae bacterium]|nr:Spo0E family sporulation regulatory protein-aspartic acid phosphatase [Thermoanaerobacteraceae bacterium]